MTLVEFLKLFMAASEEVKVEIERILTDDQSQTEHHQEHLDTSHKEE